MIALATGSIGALYSSTATDMGAQASSPSHRPTCCLNYFLQGVLDRYRQIQPKLVFAETEVVYAGKTIDLMPKVTEVALDLQDKGLQRTILLPSAKTGRDALVPSNIPNWYVSHPASWDYFTLILC